MRPPAYSVGISDQFTRAMNSDHAFLQRFQSGDRAPATITSNPLAQLLHAKLVEADHRGHAVLSFEPPAEFVQGAGVLQGGTVATMLDFALAFAALAALPAERTFATASLTVNLMKAALPGKYVARGTVERLGSQLIFATASLEREDNAQTVATASAVMPVTQVRSG
jgi:uncharacterized protein (TIGR00369 family)